MIEDEMWSVRLTHFILQNRTGKEKKECIFLYPNKPKVASLSTLQARWKYKGAITNRRWRRRGCCGWFGLSTTFQSGPLREYVPTDRYRDHHRHELLCSPVGGRGAKESRNVRRREITYLFRFLCNEMNQHALLADVEQLFEELIKYVPTTTG